MKKFLLLLFILPALCFSVAGQNILTDQHISQDIDYAIFLQMLLNKGTYNGVEILAPRTVEVMTSGQLDSTYNGVDNFGLGFDITSEKAAARDGRNAGSFSLGRVFRNHLLG